jgi:hypothetical protein
MYFPQLSSIKLRVGDHHFEFFSHCLHGKQEMLLFSPPPSPTIPLLINFTPTFTLKKIKEEESKLWGFKS